MGNPTTATEFFLRLWAEVDVSRGNSRHDARRPAFLGMVAFLLYLRYLDAKSAHGSDGGAGGVPRDLRWQKWSSLRGNNLVKFLCVTAPNLLAVNGGQRDDLHAAIKAVLAGPSRELDPAYCAFVADWVGELDLTADDGLDAARQLMDEASRWATGDNRYFGIHTTPAAVVDLMVELGQPRPGDRVYDPCFGVAGLLVGCERYIHRTLSTGGSSLVASVNHCSLAGHEINPLSFLIGAVRLLLEVDEISSLRYGDALDLPSDGLFKQQEFDVILACPPWGAAPDRGNREHFVVPSADYIDLFLQHVANNLRLGGRAVVAVPESTLFRAGPTRAVRKWLLENLRVEGVISLPAGTFSPATSVKGNLVVIRRSQPIKSLRFCVVHALEGMGQRSLLGAETPAGIVQRFRSDEQTSDSWDVRTEEIVERHHELVAKRTGEDRLAELLNAVKAATPEAEITDLGSIASIVQGYYFDRSVVSEADIAPPQSFGVVRISDLRNGKVQSPTLFVVTDDQRPTLLLEAGDVLASVSGTIGKIAVVTRSESPLVASRGLAVIRLHEGIMPEFVAALLQSEAYQDWLKGHANGSTIQHLAIRSLRRLPVVIPSATLQAQVVDACMGRKSDALSQLIGAATGQEADPIREWLAAAEPVRQLRLYKPDGDSAKVAELLDELATSVKPLRDRLAHKVAHVPDSRLAGWVSQLSELLQGLRGLSRIPDGAALLAIVDSARATLAKHMSLLEDGTGTTYGAGVALTRSVDEALAAIRERLLVAVSVVATAEPAAIQVGLKADATVLVRNRSPLPLRGLVFRTHPSTLGSSTCVFLESGQEHRLTLDLPPQNDEGFLDFELLWRGMKLDGGSIDGRLAMRLAVVVAAPGTSGALAGDLGPSPYIVGNPIDRREMFFGREEHIDRIVRQLSTKGKANVILLEGNRRTGKTSILKQLAEPGTLPGWVTVDCSFQGGEGVGGSAGLPTNEVYRLLTKQIGWRLYDVGIETWLPGVARPAAPQKFKPQFAAAVREAFAAGSPFETFELYLHEVFAAIGERRLLLMLDEFDKLQEGIAAGVTSPQVPENIRYLIHTYPQLSAILSGGRELKGLRAGYWSALFGFGHRVDVSALPLDAARELVTQPVHGRLVYVDDARDHLIELCARHPFLLQSLCNHVFEAAVRDTVRTVTVPYVDAAAAALIRDNEHFHTLWEYARTERRRYILALIERHPSDAEPISFDVIASCLEEAGIHLPRRERLGDDIDWICDLELVTREAGTSSAYYRLAVPLFGKWIHACIDFNDLKIRAAAEGQEHL